MHLVDECGPPALGDDRIAGSRIDALPSREPEGRMEIERNFYSLKTWTSMRKFFGQARATELIRGLPEGGTSHTTETALGALRPAVGHGGDPATTTPTRIYVNKSPEISNISQ
ncbi:hypothetical protein GCM10027160_06000 [Streptomyces calidiresistens]